MVGPGRDISWQGSHLFWSGYYQDRLVLKYHRVNELYVMLHLLRTTVLDGDLLNPTKARHACMPGKAIKWTGGQRLDYRFIVKLSKHKEYE